MSKTILITGSTDGIGLETSKTFLEQGHHVLLHGRNPEKLDKVATDLSNVGIVDSYLADLSDVDEVRKLAKQVSDKHDSLDVLINNAGIFKTTTPISKDGLDMRFMVNTIASYLLTKLLLPLLNNGRVINLSSAAQAPVNLDAVLGKGSMLSAIDAYSQSKLAITMWSFAMADVVDDKHPVIVAVNPGSLLASKMVKEGFGVEGSDLSIAANILFRASLSDEFSDASGKYYDNDIGRFALPHAEALDKEKCHMLVNRIEYILSKLSMP